MSAIEVGKPMPYFCPACQAIPKAGYCNLAGCPTAPPEDPRDQTIRELVEALRPFADLRSAPSAHGASGYWIRDSLIEAARTALSKAGDQ